MSAWKQYMLKQHLYTYANLGLMPGMQVVNEFGRNPDIDIASVPETLWGGSGPYLWQSSAVSLEAISTSSSDTGFGEDAGMKSILIEGLDENWNRQSVEVVINGLSAVTVPLLWRRVQKVSGRTSTAAVLTNVGTISVQVASAGDILAQILPGAGESSLGLFTVPADHSGMLIAATSRVIVGAAGAEVTVGLFSRENDVVGRPWRERNLDGLANTGSSAVVNDFPGAIILNAKEDVEMRILSVTADNLGVSGTLSIVTVEM